MRIMVALTERDTICSYWQEARFNGGRWGDAHKSMLQRLLPFSSGLPDTIPITIRGNLHRGVQRRQQHLTAGQPAIDFGRTAIDVRGKSQPTRAWSCTYEGGGLLLSMRKIFDFARFTY